jgi:hypothetical protein
MKARRRDLAYKELSRAQAQCYAFLLAILDPCKIIYICRVDLNNPRFRLLLSRDIFIDLGTTTPQGYENAKAAQKPTAAIVMGALF